MERIEQMKLQRKYSISRTAADVLLIVIDFMKASRNTGHKDAYGYYVYAGRKTIAKEIGKCAATVNRAIAELVKAGLLIVRKGIRNSHTYFTDKLNSELGESNKQQNDISPERKMYSRIKGIFNNNSYHNNLSINTEVSETPVSSDDFICQQRLQSANDQKQRRAEERKQAETAKEVKHKNILQYLKDKFNVRNETESDNESDLYIFSNELATKIAADTVKVHGIRVSVDDYLERIKRMGSSEALEALAIARDKKANNPYSYAITVLYNTVI